jgi:hypothetical protein
MRRVFVALCLLLAGGCASSSRTAASRVISDTAATAGGAALGYVASNGNVAATVGGAALGFAVKRYADNLQGQEEQKRVQAAYDSAHAQATRELYDATQRLQAISTEITATPENDGVYLPTQIPERTINGVIVEPTIEYIRISDVPAK